MTEIVKKGFTHDNINNLTNSWYTPKHIFDSLDLEFDLDPCAPLTNTTNVLGVVGGVSWIPVRKVYTHISNGLTQPWEGRVWLNPPYGRETKLWLQKMDTHRDGISLLFARTDCQWFHDYCTKATAINFLKGRLKFIDSEGVTGKSGAGAGSMLVAWGHENADAIKKVKGLYIDL